MQCWKQNNPCSIWLLSQGVVILFKNLACIFSWRYNLFSCLAAIVFEKSFYFICQAEIFLGPPFYPHKNWTECLNIAPNCVTSNIRQQISHLDSAVVLFHFPKQSHETTGPKLFLSLEKRFKMKERQLKKKM